MGDKSKIEWCDATWNVVTGCSKVSAGCAHCYAERVFKRVYPGRKFTDVQLHPERLDQPLRWRKPRMVFVNSMSDLFHEDVPSDFIGRIFGVMAYSPQHTFQVLAKRPKRMRDLLSASVIGPVKGEADQTAFELSGGTDARNWTCLTWPLPNVWLGVSVENQKTADERIPLLLETPAAVRFVSYEPALGPVDFTRCGPMFEAIDRLHAHEEAVDHGTYEKRPKLDWVIAGGESGPKARPSHPDWFRAVRDQCVAAGVPYFFKQWGEWEIASRANRHVGGVMPESNRRYTWVGKNGKTYNPSAPEGQDCWAMARVGKKAAGRSLDGREWNQFPNVNETRKEQSA